MTWAVRVSLDPSESIAMSRRRPDGVVLSWRLALAPDGGDGVVPFRIDWGDTPHPSTTAAPGGRLVSFTGTHPDPDRIAAQLAALGAELPVSEGPAGLSAVLDLAGVELRLT
ncbi:MAG TPA: VOC family protein [Sporichthya sp.]|nr:VOC family protein [Sporichthya sp.]